MYSTNIKDNRYQIQCIAVSNKVFYARFIVDTGAIFTCCTYKAFGKGLQECELSANDTKLLGGFVKGQPVKFYKLCLRQFTIGNIDLGGQDIWITFDERVTDTVFGMDILQQVIFAANPYNKKIYFCKDKADYDSNFELLTA